MLIVPKKVPQIILQNDVSPTLIKKKRTKCIHIPIKLIQTIAVFMSLRTLAKMRALFLGSLQPPEVSGPLPPAVQIILFLSKVEVLTTIF